MVVNTDRGLDETAPVVYKDTGSEEAEAKVETGDIGPVDERRKPRTWRDYKAIPKEERRKVALDRKRQMKATIDVAIEAGEITTPEGTISLEDALKRINAKSPCANYTMRNLIAVACAGTIDARSFLEWKKAGRKVKKGTHAFHVTAPFVFKDETTGDDETRVAVMYVPTPVFRYEDTEGDCVPNYEPLGERAEAKLQLFMLELTAGLSMKPKTIADIYGGEMVHKATVTEHEIEVDDYEIIAA
jgi:hypothetical protein